MIKYAVKYLKNTFVPLKGVGEKEGEEIKTPCDSDLDGKLVLVRTEKGEEVLKAFRVCSKVAELFEKSEKTPEAFEFIRIMTQEDMMIYEEIKKEEVTSFFKCKELIKKHNLNMNLVQCRFTFDKRKISFYYTAPERVDFRELLKDLTQVFKRVRIDLRHIGVRDESSIMDGTGICGKPFCCSSYLRKFESINVKLAKDQGMPIAPSKISGTCGRLLCCLTYEYENYIEAAKGMPPVGSTVMTPIGLGKVCYIQFLNNSVAVKFEDGKIKEFEKTEIEMVDANINVDIDIPRITNYAPDEKVDARQLKQLEDDRNSSTGNV
ncbi:stage 0 sporulation protein [bacterium]|nr:stage 0 sporulation protein [bacterium]